MLQAGTVSQTRIPAAVLAAANQTYDLSFDPSTGFFTLTGTGTTPTPAFLQIIVTEPNSSITITCTDGLSFEVSAGSPVSWMTSNTLHDPVIESFNASSVELVFPTPPQPYDRIGFTLSTQFTSASNQTINSLQPELYATAETLGPPPSLNLIYTPANGSFSIQGSLQDSIMDAEVMFRLGTASSNQSGLFVLELVTEGSGQAATFASPAVVFTDPNNDPLNPLTPDTVELNIPFSSNSGVGLNFVIKYEGTRIFSPDPIIIDKTIGTNPGPGF